MSDPSSTFSSSASTSHPNSSFARRLQTEYPQTPSGLLPNDPAFGEFGSGPGVIYPSPSGSTHDHYLSNGGTYGNGISQHSGSNGNVNAAASGSGSGAERKHSVNMPLSGHADGGVADAQRVSRAFGLRVIRTVRRGQLPFLLVFFSCVIVFFTALSGIGYVDPDSDLLLSADHEAEFQLGKPVFNPAGGPGGVDDEKVMEMKRLEQEWARKKRPKDGAWMKKQRDQREVRRKPLPDSRFQRQKLVSADDNQPPQVEEKTQAVADEDAQDVEGEKLD